MFENVGRKVYLILTLLVVALALIVVPDKPFQLGLDLQGGTRIVYRFDFEAARDSGQIGPNDDPAEILAQSQVIVRDRLDPTGTREISVRTEGTDRLVIEMPGDAAAEGTAEAVSPLAEGIDAAASDKLVLTDASAFSPSGVVEIGGEQIRYARNDGKALYDLTRGRNGQTAAHKPGDDVRLVNSDEIRDAIENLGDLAFVLRAEDSDFVDKDTDLSQEGEKLRKWQEANPGVPVVTFNRLAPEQGGPDPSIRWFPTKFADDEGNTITGQPMPVLWPTTPELTFTGDALQRIYNAQDSFGYPAVGFEISPQRTDDFAEFTGENVNRYMAIVLNGEVRSAPVLNTQLVGGGIIEGRFKPEEVKALVTVLRSGSLKLKPTLEHDERVGATLGDDYVRRGVYSSILAMVIVLGFMIVYYRRLGVYSAIALATNLVMFMGGLAFLQATLTLPGIAGIVLTVGMAVDANILIFDRIREEADKGRNAKQAAKSGFEMATSAIIDSNVTTFLTAVILYKLGTGPVRGFAVTLMIGVLTSVFAALVTTRVCVHVALARGVKEFKMGRWLADANWDFMSKAKIAVTASIIACVGGLAAFFSLEDSEKLGIDFTGGGEAQLETAAPQHIDTMRARVAQIPGIGSSAEVKGVLNTSTGTDEYTQFRVQFKTIAEGTVIESGEELRPILRESLGDLLLAEAVAVTVTPEGDDLRVEARLFFDQAPSVAQATEALESAGLRDVQVTVGERIGSFVASGTTAAGRDTVELQRAVSEAFARHPSGDSFRFAEAIPNFSQVGPQVVGELRDRALLALAVSLFITVLYIRVRFAEYSYGVAAIVALLHDVLITLAALSVGNHFGFVNGELNLAMIAVFLTVIGYSVNDTIVIFDRVRENLPKSKAPLRDVLNKSINETLSRTIMTSVTVFLAIIVQYAFNVGTGNVLESISYAMLFGLISGTYSTIFIANPVFLWLETRGQSGTQGGSAQSRAQRLAREAAEAERRRREEGGSEEELVRES